MPAHAPCLCHFSPQQPGAPPTHILHSASLHLGHRARASSRMARNVRSARIASAFRPTPHLLQPDPGVLYRTGAVSRTTVIRSVVYSAVPIRPILPKSTHRSHVEQPGSYRSLASTCRKVSCCAMIRPEGMRVPASAEESDSRSGYNSVCCHSTSRMSRWMQEPQDSGRAGPCYLSSANTVQYDEYTLVGGLSRRWRAISGTSSGTVMYRPIQSMVDLKLVPRKLRNRK